MDHRLDRPSRPAKTAVPHHPRKPGGRFEPCRPRASPCPRRAAAELRRGARIHIGGGRPGLRSAEGPGFLGRPESEGRTGSGRSGRSVASGGLRAPPAVRCRLGSRPRRQPGPAPPAPGAPGGRPFRRQDSSFARDGGTGAAPSGHSWYRQTPRGPLDPQDVADPQAHADPRGPSLNASAFAQSCIATGGAAGRPAWHPRHPLLGALNRLAIAPQLHHDQSPSVQPQRAHPSALARRSSAPERACTWSRAAMVARWAGRDQLSGHPHRAHTPAVAPRRAGARPGPPGRRQSRRETSSLLARSSNPSPFTFAGERRVSATGPPGKQ
jgi:hypothetical protein